MLTYILHDMAARSATLTGGAFPIGGRTRFSAGLEVGRVLSAGSITVAIETAPINQDDAYSVKYSFAAQTAEGFTEAKSYGQTPEFTLTSRDRWVRMVVTALTGEFVFRLTLDGRFFDPRVPADKARLPSDLRDFDDGLDRLCKDAEREVLSTLAGREPGVLVDQVFWPPNDEEAIGTSEVADDVPAGLVFDVNLELASSYDAIRAEIIRQAKWLLRRYDLSKDGTADAMETLHAMDYRDPDLGRGIRKFRRRRSVMYLGRG